MATTALSVFETKLDRFIGDYLVGTTTSDGSADKNTLVDSALEQYSDAWFGDPERNSQWWVYASSQLKSIKRFVIPSGTILVNGAFSAKIVSSTAYELHKFNRDLKIIACNRALYDCYPHFHLVVSDLTTLDGKGPSDNQYEVPSTFEHFPEQIFSEYESGSVIKYIPVSSRPQTIGGKMYFYANIPTGRDIHLIGKKHLSQFSNDASTTELSDGQANTVVILAAAIFYRTLSGLVNAADSERFDSLANRYEAQWEERKLRDAMPFQDPRTLDFGWLGE